MSPYLLKQEQRFVTEIFVPLLIGAALILIWCHGIDQAIPDIPGTSRTDMAAPIPLFFIVSFIFAIFYATTMEAVFDLGLKPSRWSAVLLSEIFGGLTGMVLDLVFLRTNTRYNLGLAFEMLGLLGGLTMGLMIKWFCGKPGIRNFI